MKRNFLPVLLLILAVAILIYTTVDYFMMDAAYNYWLFFIAIVLMFFGIAIRSKSSK